MQIERRALYNLLRMNWQMDPNIDVEPWQIENYRTQSSEHLFEILKRNQLDLDRNRFIAFAEQSDNPEQFTNNLIDERDYTSAVQDQIYLVLFELWRRLLPEKPSLSVFCDELDYQINLYDYGKIENIQALQDAISNLKAILDENVDGGSPPHEVFAIISSNCAHDIETFLYDFIAEQIDLENYSYAEELLDNFIPYISDIHWFHFLRAQVIATKDEKEANRLLQQLVKKHSSEPNLEFNLELLSFMTREGELNLFIQLVKQSLPLIKYEEDFQDLLAICADFYHYLDKDSEEKAIQEVILDRTSRPTQATIDQHEPHFRQLIEIMDRSLSSPIS